MSEGFPFEATARAFAHPLGPGLPERGWTRARKVRPRGRGAWEGVGVDLGPLEWPEQDTREGWVGAFDALLKAYGLEDKATSWPREVAALANARDAVAWLGEPGEERITRGQFVEEVGEVLRVADTPAHPAREGVVLHTPLSLYGARYRYAFVLGLVEGAFPPPAADDPALDFRERKKLGEEGLRLELADERARRERLSFWTLLRVPEERLILSHPKLMGGREALPSPYFGLVGA